MNTDEWIIVVLSCLFFGLAFIWINSKMPDSPKKKKYKEDEYTIPHGTSHNQILCYEVNRDFFNKVEYILEWHMNSLTRVDLVTALILAHRINSKKIIKLLLDNITNEDLSIPVRSIIVQFELHNVDSSYFNESLVSPHNISLLDYLIAIKEIELLKLLVKYKKIDKNLISDLN